MEWLSPIYFIAEKIANAKRYKEEYELMNLAFIVLLYFQEITLSEDRGCDVEEIAGFLKKLITHHYDKDIPFRDALDLATFIVEDIFRNGGAFFRLNTRDFTSEKNIKNMVIKLIETDQVGLLDDQYNTYKITNLGCEVLFRTLEIDKTMRISMEMLRLQQEFEKGNYDTAYRSTQELLNLSRQLRMEIEETIRKIKVNIDLIVKEEIDELHNRLDINFEKERQSFEKLLNQVYTRIEMLNQEIELEYNQHKEKMLYMINRVSENLDKIILEFAKVLRFKQGIDLVYEKALIDSIDIGSHKRITFNKLLDDFEGKGLTDENTVKLMKPLLSFKFNKRLNLKKIFEEQRVISENKKEKTNDNRLDMKGLVDNSEKERVKEINEHYIKILDTLIKYSYSNGGTVTLSELLKALKNNEPEVYEEISNDRNFYVVLVRIYQSEGRYINLVNNYKTYKDLKLIPQSDFVFNYIIGKLLDRKKSYRNIKGIYIEKDSNELIIINNRFKVTNVRIGVETIA